MAAIFLCPFRWDTDCHARLAGLAMAEEVQVGALAERDNATYEKATSDRHHGAMVRGILSA